MSGRGAQAGDEGVPVRIIRRGVPPHTTTDICVLHGGE
jgi:hypothetical protein